MEKIFISGQISGLDYNVAKWYFNNTEVMLEGLGYDVVNPTKLCDSNWHWLRCMYICIVALADCDAVYFLPNYKHSKGARVEMFFAKLFGKSIIFG